MFAAYRQLSRNTVILSGSIGAVLATYFAWYSLLPLHLRALGANDTEIGAAYSIFIFCHTVPAVTGGLLADRFGRKGVALGPGLVLAPLYILAGLATDWRVLTGILVLANIAGSIQWPAMQAMVSESDDATRSTAFSLIEVFVLAAAVLGPLLGSVFLPFVGVGGLLIAGGLMMIPATWVRARELRETHHPEARERMTRINWRRAITPAVGWIIFATTMFTLADSLSVLGPFAAILARDGWSLTDQQIQQLSALGALAAFGGVWVGSKADRWGTRRVWMMTAGGLAVALAGWGLARNVQVGMVFVMASNLCFEALFIVSETLLAHHTTHATRSFLFGLCATLGGGVQAAGPALGSWLIGGSRLGAPFLAGALVNLLGIAALTPVSDTPREETAPVGAAE